MAKPKVSNAIVLPKARQKALEDMQPIIDELTRKIPRLKALKMDTTELENRLELTVTMRDILLQEFVR